MFHAISGVVVFCFVFVVLIVVDVYYNFDTLLSYIISNHRTFTLNKNNKINTTIIVNTELCISLYLCICC